jgi:hypothetical protein
MIFLFSLRYFIIIPLIIRIVKYTVVTLVNIMELLKI